MLIPKPFPVITDKAFKKESELGDVIPGFPSMKD
jgi:hypothetical protein